MVLLDLIDIPLCFHQIHDRLFVAEVEALQDGLAAGSTHRECARTPLAQSACYLLLLRLNLFL